MTLTEKSAYLKGLAEGIKLSDDDNGKVLKAIIELLDDITNELADVADGVDELCEQIDAVDEDLANLEEYVYDDDEDDCCCCDDDEVFEVECPECHDIVYLDYEMLEDGEIACPNCGKRLELEFDDCDCDCGCECGDDCQCTEEDNCGCDCWKK